MALAYGYAWHNVALLASIMAWDLDMGLLCIMTCGPILLWYLDGRQIENIYIIAKYTTKQPAQWSVYDFASMRQA